MLKLKCLLLFILFYTICFAQKSPCKKCCKAELKLLSESDQQYRWHLTYRIYNSKVVDSINTLDFETKIKFMNNRFNKKLTLEDSIGLIKLSMLQKNIDSLNFDYVKTKFIYGKCKWNDIFNIIIWHQNVDTISHYLPKLKMKKIPNITYAEIYDKLQYYKDKTQLYGVLFNNLVISGEEKNIPVIKNIDTTNLARKKIGLNPLKHYEILK